MAREEEEEVVRVLTLPLQAHHAMEKMEEFVYKVWELLGIPGGSWRLCSASGAAPASSGPGSSNAAAGFAGCLCSALVLMVTTFGKCMNPSTVLWPARLLSV